MPWKIYRNGDQYCVHKQNADDSMGDLIPGGCHADRADAIAHQRAMYASEAKEITDATLALLKEITEDGEPDKYDRSQAVLSEWESRMKAALPVEGDDEDDEDEKQAEEIPDVVTDETPVETPEVSKKDLLARLKEVYSAVITWFKDKDEPDTDGSPMTIWKEGDNYWWLARYSNKYRDQDNPPEIISSDSHRRFVQLVKEGKAPLPELWLWHNKEWKVGQAHGVAYDELGFAVAIGTFDADKGFVAEALMKSKDPVRVSHGMPYMSIRRDDKDRTIITEHETREISPLPAWAAANKLTGFVVLDLESKEEVMAIPDEMKAEWISKLGISPETLENLEAANAADADKAVSEGLESKEADVPEAAQPAAQEAPAPETPAETPAVTAVEPALTLDQLREAVQEGIKSVVSPMMERMEALEAGLKEVKDANTAQAEVLKGTPAVSLSSLMAQFAKSAIGASETKVDGRTELAKSKPAETAANLDGVIPVPFIRDLISGNQQ